LGRLKEVLSKYEEILKLLQPPTAAKAEQDKPNDIFK
jgi:hypothetical protein